MKRNRIHMIANAHIDPAWMWNWQEGYAEILATFKSALDRLNETPALIFTASSAAYYKWVEEIDPDMFEQIRKCVKEGRWVLAGGWWVEPDCNIPCGESFARQGLYSQRYFLEKFGTICKTGYNLDSFGHSSVLPQLLLKSGMNGYVFQRPEHHENKDIPVVFIWEGSDGSRIIAHKITTGYSSRLKPCPGLDRTNDAADKLDTIKNTAAKTGLNLMCFFGVGNHGGGPAIRDIKKIEKYIESDYPHEIIFSSPDDYFREIEDKKNYLPLYRGDLLHHAAGSYTSVSKIKKNNRITENKLIKAEKYITAAGILFSSPCPINEIRKAWESTLFNQFHDIMAGCSIKPVCDESDIFYGYSLKIADRISAQAVQKISWNINTRPDGVSKPLESKLGDSTLWDLENRGAPLVLFNSLSWPAKAPIRVNTRISSVVDNEGHSLPLQRITSPRFHFVERDDFIFLAEIPPFGYTTYRIFKEKTMETQDQSNLVSGEWFMENRFLRVEFDASSGLIKKLIGKKSRMNLIKDGANPLVMSDRSDAWGHGIDSYRDIFGVFKLSEIKVVESGSVRSVISIKSTFHESEVHQDFILYNDLDRLFAEVRIDWHEKDKMLKFAFPTTLTESVPEYELPYGFAERESDGKEMPGQSMVDLTGSIDGKKYGLTVLNDSKYAYDVLNNELRITVLRSPVYNSHFRREKEDCIEVEYIDHGVQIFTYALMVHEGKRRAKHVRAAYELNNPPDFVYDTLHDGSLPARNSFLTIDKENVICTVFKRSEDDTGYVVRLFEIENRTASAVIHITLLDVRMEAEFNPGEIKSYYISDQKIIKEINLLEFPLSSE
jgi:alpha-mannosidase